MLDTDPIVAAMRSDRGAPRQLRLAALGGGSRWWHPSRCEAVLTRTEHLNAIGVTAAEVNTVLDALAAVVEPAAFRFLWRPQLRDPGDEMVLETPVNGLADRLATFNVRHLDPVGRRFGIRVMLPGAVLREMRGIRHEKK